jgi:hypothetical protein
MERGWMTETSGIVVTRTRRGANPSQKSPMETYPGKIEGKIKVFSPQDNLKLE